MGQPFDALLPNFGKEVIKHLLNVLFSRYVFVPTSRRK